VRDPKGKGLTSRKRKKGKMFKVWFFDCAGVPSRAQTSSRSQRGWTRANTEEKGKRGRKKERQGKKGKGKPLQKTNLGCSAAQETELWGLLVTKRKLEERGGGNRKKKERSERGGGKVFIPLLIGQARRKPCLTHTIVPQICREGEGGERFQERWERILWIGDRLG